MNRNFKKQLAAIFNETNQEIFNTGVHNQKIEIMGNKVLIIASTKRMPALDALGEEYAGLVLSMDAAVSVKYKQILKEKLEQELDLKVTSLFRDYEPDIGSSCTVICFENLITD
ncbi:Na-translocating system protein MpsC family protein [Niallia sp. 03133]|uniref:Na-translocating system protein MpsC family protein n=1 Tax=Niallia sp. 03133 TaxID=3458060 RepID=UPI004043C3CD